MMQCAFSLVAAQPLAKMTPHCRKANVAAQLLYFRKWQKTQIGHGSSSHSNAVKPELRELLYPWREELPNSDSFLNPRLAGPLYRSLSSKPTLEPQKGILGRNPLFAPKAWNKSKSRIFSFIAFAAISPHKIMIAVWRRLFSVPGMVVRAGTGLHSLCPVGAPQHSCLSGPNRAMQPRCAMRFESHTPKSLAMRKCFFASDAKTHSLDLKSHENVRKKARENPAMLACDAKNRGGFKIERCEMPAIWTPAAVWPAMRAPAMPNR